MKIRSKYLLALLGLLNLTLFLIWVYKGRQTYYVEKAESLMEELAAEKDN